MTQTKKQAHASYILHRTERLARAKLYRESHRAEVVAGTRRWKAAHRAEVNASARAAYAIKAEERCLERSAERKWWITLSPAEKAAIAIERSEYV